VVCAQPVEPVTEILNAARAQLPTHTLTLALLMFAAGCLATLDWVLAKTFSAKLRRGLFYAVIAAATGFGLYQASKVLWLCDDAFISFTYSQNFANGHGLVFNPGEWVEGYTNFLWTLLLGLLAKVGAPIPHTALIGNLLSFVGVLWVTGSIVWRARGGRGVLIPFATLVVAGAQVFTTFASSGLETMPATLCVLLALWAVTRVAHPSRRSLAASSVFLALAALCRPDHGLFAVALGLALVLEELIDARRQGTQWRLRFERLLFFVGPFVAIYVPYFLIRWHAYGDLFPNTFYAKSGGDSYLSQGLVYLVETLVTTGGLVWLPAFLLLVVFPPRALVELRLRVFGFFSLLLYGGYVVRVGGDFMEHRFFVVLLAIVAVCLEVMIRDRIARAPRWGKAVLGLLAVTTAATAVLPIRVMPPLEKKWNIAAEETYYPLTSLRPLRVGSGFVDIGQALHSAFAAHGVFPKYATGCVGMVGFYSGVPIVDLYGLVSRRIAHKTISQRGRPGHEKSGDVEDALEEGAVIHETQMWPEFADVAQIEVDGKRFSLLQYDPKVLEPISRIPGAHVPDLPALIRALAAQGDVERITRGVTFYSRFLRLHPQREALLQPLRARLGTIADFEDGVPSTAKATGELHAHATDSGRPTGVIGRGWVSLDSGALRISIPRVEAGELRFAFAGAPSAKASLEVEGAQVLTAPGRGADALRSYAWDVSPHLGKQAVFVIEGEHLQLDAVRFVLLDAARAKLQTTDALTPEAAIELLREVEAELPPTDPAMAPLLARQLGHFDFDTAAAQQGVSYLGGAFGGGPATGTLTSQTPVTGFSGAGFLNSYHGLDGEQGEVRIELGALPAGVGVGFLVGGTGDCTHGWVALELDGRETARACGRNDEVLRPGAFRVDRPATTATLRVVDMWAGGWGHILLDDVRVVR
jgi:hypothetical protein